MRTRTADLKSDRYATSVVAVNYFQQSIFSLLDFQAHHQLLAASHLTSTRFSTGDGLTSHHALNSIFDDEQGGPLLPSFHIDDDAM